MLGGLKIIKGGEIWIEDQFIGYLREDLMPSEKEYYSRLLEDMYDAYIDPDFAGDSGIFDPTKQYYDV